MLPLVLALTIHLHKGDVFGPPPKATLSSWVDPAATGPHPSAISFKASDGTVIRGWVFENPAEDAPLVLYFYGSNEDARIEARRMMWLSSAARVNAVVFDYRGYGFSDGVIAPEAMRKDALEAFDALRRRSPRAPIFVYGWSVGAEFAIHVAALRDVAGLVVQAPPASAVEMQAWSNHHDVPGALRWAVHLQGDADYETTFQGAAEISTVRAPLLVIQGDRDDDVPISQGREVFSASASQTKQFCVVPGGHHNDIRISEPPAGPALIEFLESGER